MFHIKIYLDVAEGNLRYGIFQNERDDWTYATYLTKGADALKQNLKYTPWKEVVES